MSNAVGHHLAIQAMDTANTAQQDAQRAQNQIVHLQRDVDRLLMITEALWTLLKEQHGYTDETLSNAITQIDLRDGQLGGRPGRTPAEPCPHCGRNLAKGLPTCIYCGKPAAQNPFAR